jgi:hypothetical protein
VTPVPVRGAQGPVGVDAMSQYEGDDYDEPVSCVECGRIHELQESRFCPHHKGLCRRCWDAHQGVCRNGSIQHPFKPYGHASAYPDPRNVPCWCGSPKAEHREKCS